MGFKGVNGDVKEIEAIGFSSQIWDLKMYRRQAFTKS